MMRPGLVTLISESPEAHGVGIPPQETGRVVYCTVRSIGMQEAYQAMGVGLNPEYKLILSHDFEYQGEQICEFEGKRYKIIRTYATETDGVELTIQRMEGNARRGEDEQTEPVQSDP